MRGVGKFRKLSLGFVTSILILNPIFACEVSAYDPPIGCSDAVLTVNDPLEPSIFTISVECLQQIYFVNPDNSVNVAGIALNGVSPTNADVVGSKLNLTFNYFDFSDDGNTINLINRLLNIDAGLLMDDSGISNTAITINTLHIMDKVSPSANPDRYEISGGSLSVASDKGLLSNDFEYESKISEIKIDEGPIFGQVDVKSDGSFVYTYNSGSYGDDEFYYHSIDSSGNVGNSVSVKIVDAPPEIRAKFYNSNSVDSIYAKPGDLLRLDFSVSDDSIIDGVSICGKLIQNYSIVNPGSYRAEYTTSSEDSEGWCVPWIKVHDILNQETTYQGSDAGLYFDKTNPVIDFARGNDITVGIYEGFDYLSGVTAYDVSPDGDFIGGLQFTVTGSVDFDRVGTYQLSFRTVDRAVNVTIERQVYRIYDAVNDKYSALADKMTRYGIASNLSDIYTDNYGDFEHLYFEKTINNKKIGRIEFNGPIDIASFEDLFQDFINSLPEKFKANSFGEVGIDLSNFEDQLILMSGGAEIKFYNLNEIGYSNGSKQSDIISNILVYNDEGILISADDVLSFGSFSGCGLNFGDCYTFSMMVGHFSKYVIKNDTSAPEITLNKIKNYKIGELVKISGYIDDSDAVLIVTIDGHEYVVPKANISSGEWFFEINSEILGAGNHSVTISATDFGNNKSYKSDKFNIIKKTASVSESTQTSLDNALSQPASIISDNPTSILGDKIKGRTKSTAVVLKSDFGLDKNELGLILIVVILGVVIIAIDRRQT